MAAVQFGIARPGGAEFVETPRILRQPVHLRARRDTLEFWRDEVKLVRAALMAHAAFLARLRAGLIEEAKQAVRFGGATGLVEIPAGEVHAHGLALAQILAAAEMTGRLRTRNQARDESGSLPVIPSGARDLQFTEVIPQNIPPAEIVAYIRALPAVERSRFESFVAKYERQAFTVSGIESERTLRALRNLIAESVEKGWSIARFEEEARRQLAALSSLGDGRLRTVWNMTVSNALREGRYSELRDPDVARLLTHFLFDAILDGRVRPNHAALENGIAPVDWPGWATYGDPLGFNCRCTRTAITAGRARRMIESGEGHDLTAAIPAGAGPDPGFRRLI